MPGTPEHKCDFNHKISNLLLESRKRRKKQTKKKNPQRKTQKDQKPNIGIMQAKPGKNLPRHGQGQQYWKKKQTQKKLHLAKS